MAFRPKQPVSIQQQALRVARTPRVRYKRETAATTATTTKGTTTYTEEQKTQYEKYLDNAEYAYGKMQELSDRFGAENVSRNPIYIFWKRIYDANISKVPEAYRTVPSGFVGPTQPWYIQPEPTETKEESISTTKQAEEYRATLYVQQKEVERSSQESYQIGDETLSKEEVLQRLQEADKDVDKFVAQLQYQNYQRAETEKYLNKLRDKGFDAYIDDEGVVHIYAPEGMTFAEENYFKILYAPEFYKYSVKTEKGEEKEITKNEALKYARQEYDVEAYAAAERLKPWWETIGTTTLQVLSRGDIAGPFWAETKEKFDVFALIATGVATGSLSTEQLTKEFKEAQDAEWERLKAQGRFDLGFEDAKVKWDNGDYLGALSFFLPEIIFLGTTAASFGIGGLSGQLAAKSVALYGAGTTATRTATAIKAAVTIGLSLPMAYQIVSCVQQIQAAEAQINEIKKQYSDVLQSITDENEKKQLEREMEQEIYNQRRIITAAYGSLTVLGIQSIIAFAAGVKGYKSGYAKGMKKYFEPGTLTSTIGGKQTVFYEPKKATFSYSKEFTQHIKKMPKIGQYKGQYVDIVKPMKFRETGFGFLAKEDIFRVTPEGTMFIPKNTLIARSYAIQQWKRGLLGYRFKTIKAETIGMTGLETGVKISGGKRAGVKLESPIRYQFTKGGKTYILHKGAPEITLTEGQMKYPIFGKQGKYYAAVSRYSTPKYSSISKQVMQLREMPSSEVAKLFQQRVFYTSKVPQLDDTLAGLAKFRTTLYEYQTPEALSPPKRSVWSDISATQSLTPVEEQIFIQPPKSELIPATEIISQIPLTTPVTSVKTGISPMLVSPQITTPIKITTTETKLDQMIKPELALDIGKISLLSTKQQQSVKQAVEQATRQTQFVKQASAQKQAQAQKQAVEQPQKLVQVLQQPVAPALPVGVPVTIPFSFILKGEAFPKAKKKPKIGYDTYVKRVKPVAKKSRYKKVTKEPLTRKQALGYGANIVDNTLSDRFYVKKSKKAPISKPKYSNTWQVKKHKFDKKKGKYIEKTDYLLDTQGELKGVEEIISEEETSKPNIQFYNPFKQQKKSKQKRGKKVKNKMYFNLTGG